MIVTTFSRGILNSGGYCMASQVSRPVWPKLSCHALGTVGACDIHRHVAPTGIRHNGYFCYNYIHETC